MVTLQPKLAWNACCSSGFSLWRAELQKSSLPYLTCDPSGFWVWFVTPYPDSLNAILVTRKGESSNAASPWVRGGVRGAPGGHWLSGDRLWAVELENRLARACMFLIHRGLQKLLCSLCHLRGQKTGVFLSIYLALSFSDDLLI